MTAVKNWIWDRLPEWFINLSISHGWFGSDADPNPLQLSPDGTHRYQFCGNHSQVAECEDCWVPV